jgi:hypothetical protein
MPFKSEKQRRFLWAKHPEIAKRWADEYPGQKNLPMYANQGEEEPAPDKEKAAFILPGKKLTFPFYTGFFPNTVFPMKQANSMQKYIEIPHSDEPTYAGEEHAEVADSGKPVQEGGVNAPAAEKMEKSPLLQKLSAVLSRPLLQFLEDEKATQQARLAARIPQNANLKQYPVATPTIPPPMGMAQAPAQPTPQPQPQQPAQPAQARPVGNGAGPTANPINSFGALSASGNINGNAAFGIKNSPDSLKTAADVPAQFYLRSKHEGGRSNVVFPGETYYADINGQLARARLARLLNGVVMAAPGDTNAAQFNIDGVDALPAGQQIALHTGRGKKRQIGHLTAADTANSPDSLKTALDKQAYGAWDEYAVSERTPWYDFKTKNKLPEYLERAQALADQQGYQLNFTNQRYTEGVPGKEYAANLRKLPHPIDENDDNFPHFFSMFPRDNRSFLQRMLRAKPQAPKHTVDYLHGHHISDQDRTAWRKHVDENWPVYRAYKEIYESPKTKTAQSDFLAKVMNMDFPPYPDPEDLELDDEERMKTSSEQPTPTPKPKKKAKPAGGHNYMPVGVVAGLLLSKALRTGYRAYQESEDSDPMQYSPDMYNQSDLPATNNDSKYAGLMDFLKKTPKPADDWSPPVTPRYDWKDENSDWDVHEKQYSQWEKNLRQYLKTKGYSQIKQHYYEPGGTPLSMRGRDGKYHEIWYPEENEPMRPPTALEDIYDSGDPNRVYRKGPGLMRVGPKQADVAKYAAFEFGQKMAAYRALQDIPSGAGPNQIEDAVMRFNQLRALVRPDTETLKDRSLSRGGFQHELRRIATNSQGKEKYNLSQMAPNPNLRAAIAGAAGLAGTGALAYMNGAEGLGAGLAGTGLAAGGAYLHGLHQRKNFKNTSKLLKDYGLLKPELLRQAYPLLADNYRAG